MAEINMKLAQQTYRTLLKAIAENGWSCRQDDNNLSIYFGVNGEDLKMGFDVSIDASRQLVRLSSMLPFNFPKDKIIDGARATSAANYLLCADGSFDFNVLTGEVSFRMTTGYRSSQISSSALVYLVNYATWAVDKANDKLLMISNGMMTVEQFKQFLRN